MACPQDEVQTELKMWMGGLPVVAEEWQGRRIKGMLANSLCHKGTVADTL